MILGVAMGYGALRTRVSDMKDDIKDIKVSLESSREENKQILKEISQLHTDNAVLAALVNSMEIKR